MDLQIDAGGACLLIKILSALSLYQAKLKNGRCPGRKQVLRMVPNVLEKAILALHVPRENICVGPVWAEQFDEPFVQGNVHSAEPARERQGERRLTGANRTLYKVNMCHGYCRESCVTAAAGDDCK